MSEASNAFAAGVDVYAVLGVARDSTQDEIKTAYRAAAARTHPDKVAASRRAAATEEFKRLSQAHEVLSDPELREEYDLYARHFKLGTDGDYLSGAVYEELASSILNLGGAAPAAVDAMRRVFGPVYFAPGRWARSASRTLWPAPDAETSRARRPADTAARVIFATLGDVAHGSRIEVLDGGKIRVVTLPLGVLHNTRVAIGPDTWVIRVEPQRGLQRGGSGGSVPDTTPADVVTDIPVEPGKSRGRQGSVIDVYGGKHMWRYDAELPIARTVRFPGFGLPRLGVARATSPRGSVQHYGDHIVRFVPRMPRAIK